MTGIFPLRLPQMVLLGNQWLWGRALCALVQRNNRITEQRKKRLKPTALDSASARSKSRSKMARGKNKIDKRGIVCIITNQKALPSQKSYRRCALSLREYAAYCRGWRLFFMLRAHVVAEAEKCNAQT